MKYLVFAYLFLTGFVCSGQPTIVLSKDEEVKEIAIYSEMINGYLNYECSFDIVFNLENEGWTIAEYQEGLKNSAHYRVAYLGFALVKKGVDYYTVIDLLEIEKEFYPTLYWIGCKPYNFVEHD